MGLKELIDFANKYWLQIAIITSITSVIVAIFKGVSSSEIILNIVSSVISIAIVAAIFSKNKKLIIIGKYVLTAGLILVVISIISLVMLAIYGGYIAFGGLG